MAQCASFIFNDVAGMLDFFFFPPVELNEKFAILIGFPDQRRTELHRTTGLSDQQTTGASERA